MAGYQYSTPFQGFSQGLPQGYMQAATDPGRNIAAGINSFGDSMTAALERYAQKKDESDYTDQKNADMFQMIHQIAQTGNIMDSKSPESQLLKSVMGFTGQKDIEKLGEYAVNSPSLNLAKKKALSHDLEFALSRYDTNRTKDAEIAYRQALTQNMQQEMAQRQGTIAAQKGMLNVPTTSTVITDRTSSVGIKDENGIPLAGTDVNQIGTTTKEVPKSRTELYRNIAKVYADNGVPIPHEAINQHLDSIGSNPEVPKGMVPTEMIQKTPNGSVKLENLDQKFQNDFALLQAKARATPLNKDQSDAVGFSKRLIFNEGVIKKLDSKGYDGTGLFDNTWQPEFYKDDDRKAYESAKKNWIAAILRKESGAAISNDEYKNADKQYFPQEYDGASVLDQKKKLREIELKSMLLSAGPVGSSMVDDGKQRFKWNGTTGQLE